MSETKLTFEEGTARLEQINEQLAAESVSLEESLQLYSQAAEIVGKLGKILDDAQQRVEVLDKETAEYQ